MAFRVLVPRPEPVKLTVAPGSRRWPPRVSIEVLPEAAWAVLTIELPPADVQQPERLAEIVGRAVVAEIERAAAEVDRGVVGEPVAVVRAVGVVDREDAAHRDARRGEAAAAAAQRKRAAADRGGSEVMLAPVERERPLAGLVQIAVAADGPAQGQIRRWLSTSNSPVPLAASVKPRSVEPLEPVHQSRCRLAARSQRRRAEGRRPRGHCCR